jgi:hypothetical protein
MLIRLSGLNQGYFAKLGAIWQGHLDRCIECRRPIYDRTTGDQIIRVCLGEYGVDVSGGHFSLTTGRICAFCAKPDFEEIDYELDYNSPIA